MVIFPLCDDHGNLSAITVVVRIRREWPRSGAGNVIRLTVISAAVLNSITVATAGEASDRATPSPAATPFDCPISQPNGNDPPSEAIVAGRGPGGYGNDALWTSLTMWSEQPGLVPAPNDAHLQPDGSVNGLKWAWYRYVPGTLTIEGRRLEAPAPPLEAWVPDGYGDQGFQVSGITFPSNGCWEVTGHVGENSLTFVVLVIWPDGFVPNATPIPQPSPSD
jgi:hypothetical protein